MITLIRLDVYCSKKEMTEKRMLGAFTPCSKPHIVYGHHVVFRLRKKQSHVGDLSRQTLRLFILGIHVSSVTILYIILK